MSVKCGKPLDELTVQVWLLYDHPNFKYCILFISGTELRTDGRTNDPNTRCPRRTFQARGIKIYCKISPRTFIPWQLPRAPVMHGLDPSEHHLLWLGLIYLYFGLTIKVRTLTDASRAGSAWSKSFWASSAMAWVSSAFILAFPSSSTTTFLTYRVWKKVKRITSIPCLFCIKISIFATNTCLWYVVHSEGDILAENSCRKEIFM